MGQELISKENKNNLPIILKAKVEKAEMLLSCSEKQLSEYRTKISVSESIGDGMAYLVGKDIMIERRVVCAIIERLLAGLALSLNVGKNLEPHQLSGLAIKIYAKYYYFSFDELMYVFDKGSSGQYGKLYDRVDEEIIFTWLQMYDTGERLAEAQTKHSDEIKETKMSDEEINILSKVYEKVISHQEQEKAKEEYYKKFREQYFNPSETDKRK
jgi:hypothetical protein